MVHHCISVHMLRLHRENFPGHSIIANRLILTLYFNIPSLIPCNSLITRLIYMADKQPFSIPILTHLIKQIVRPVSVFFVFHSGWIYTVKRENINVNISLRLQCLHKTYTAKRNMYRFFFQLLHPVTWCCIYKLRCLAHENNFSTALHEIFQFFHSTAA